MFRLLLFILCPSQYLLPLHGIIDCLIFSLQQEVDRLIRAAPALMLSLYCSIWVNRELSQKTKLPIYMSVYVSTLIDYQELWILTERMRLQIQVAKISFLSRVAGLSFRDKVRSSDSWREFRLYISLLQEEQAMVVWVFGHERFTFGCVSGMSCWQETPLKTQDTVEILLGNTLGFDASYHPRVGFKQNIGEWSLTVFSCDCYL